jgi:hypothetical protein
MGVSQNEKILKWFFYITAVVTFIGSVVMMADGDFDIYTMWHILGYGSGIYLINKLK